MSGYVWVQLASLARGRWNTEHGLQAKRLWDAVRRVAEGSMCGSRAWIWPVAEGRMRQTQSQRELVMMVKSVWKLRMC